MPARKQVWRGRVDKFSANSERRAPKWPSGQLASPQEPHILQVYSNYLPQAKQPSSQAILTGNKKTKGFNLHTVSHIYQTDTSPGIGSYSKP